MGRLEGSVAFITGAGSGIGAACALRFAEEGARLAGFDLTEAPLEDWCRAVEKAPAAIFSTGDVRDESCLQQVIAEVRARLGRLDVVVNAAGVAGGGPVHLAPAEE